jgi:Flp pilus assembly protein TadG
MRERGQSIVELAFLLPILLIILLGVLDLGRVYYVMVALEAMAAEGATFAGIRPQPADVAEVQERAAAGSRGLVEVHPSVVRVEYPATVQPGAAITVTVPLEFQFVTPFVSAMFENGTVELRGTAVGTVISGY